MFTLSIRSPFWNYKSIIRKAAARINAYSMTSMTTRNFKIYLPFKPSYKIFDVTLVYYCNILALHFCTFILKFKIALSLLNRIAVIN